MWKKKVLKKKKKNQLILANEGMKYESVPLLLYLPTAACWSHKWVEISAWWICLEWKEAKNYFNKCFSLTLSMEA